jgi:exodeoxyribonuclease V beta subunit
VTGSTELPGEGLRCIEASAGTGKTHRLSTLAARWLVERSDVPPSGLLVVTYTIAAARELRARIRERLVEVRGCLVEPAEPLRDDLAWCAAPPDRDAWVARSERALAGFDEISISTIHAFAAAALGGSLRAVDTSDLRRRHAVAEVLAAAAFDPSDALLGSSRVATTTLDAAVSRALDNPDAVLTPFERADATGAARAHVRAVERAIAGFEEQGRRDGVHTYADLITDLHSALSDEGSPLLATLRARYSVGLIDEFQDTDPLQWEIFRRLFLDVPGRTLVVVGDPKQAIYGFRGADVDTYLAARAQAASSSADGARIESLARNYRSDRALLRALNQLFDGAAFDDQGAIRYVPVEPAPDAIERAIVADPTTAAPLSIRVPIWGSVAAERQRAIAEDCAQAASDALGTSLAGPSGALRVATEGDVVVLCRARTQFPLLRAAFLRRGIRTTEAKTDDVLESVAALDVAVALRAMGEPTNAGAVLAVAHSWLATDEVGGDPVGTARRRITEWSAVLEARGVASFARALTDPRRSPGLLATPGGERLVTDVHHVCEVLADAAPHGAGAVQLLETLDELRAIDKAPDDELRTRRIDTDEPAVRLMTVHGAKGLEFPIVLCPFLQNFRSEPRPATMWRDASRQGRMLDASGGSAWVDSNLAEPSREDRERCVASAEAGELRRLLYVALTRAKHRTVVWWEARTRRQGQHLDELTWLLLDRDDEGHVARRPRPERSDDDAAVYDLNGNGAIAQLRVQFSSLLDAGDLELTEVRMPTPLSATAQPSREAGSAADPQFELDVAVLDRALVQRAPRCSFSSLVADSHQDTSLDPLVGDGRADDEPVTPDDLDAGPSEQDLAPVDPFGGARGTAFGTAVHEALEAAFARHVDESFDDALAVGLQTSSRRNGVELPPETLGGLLTASAARIGEAPSLRELALDDVSVELRFQLPVADGVGLGDVARRLLAANGAGPFAAWAEGLASDPERRPLAAGLVGSIDLVSSLGTSERYGVLDYKTNVVRTNDYGPDGLRTAMCESDYPLQALLYLVALHRLLRWRRPDYDPSRHLGGAHYLFLRGMRPGSSEGVVSWFPGHQAIRSVSDLLAGAA